MPPEPLRISTDFDTQPLGSAKRQRVILDRENHALDSLLQADNIKIDEQAQNRPSGFEIGRDLSIVDGG